MRLAHGGIARMNISLHTTSIFKHCQGDGVLDRQTARCGRAQPTLAGAGSALPYVEGVLLTVPLRLAVGCYNMW
jgi:hypothetical protein